MESLGTSPKRNDGGDGRPWGVAAQSWATALATLTEKRAMKKEEEEQIDSRLKFMLYFVWLFSFLSQSKNDVALQLRTGHFEDL